MAWNPHCSDKFIVGGNGSFRLLDLRICEPNKNPVVLTFEKAHNGAIRDVKWNPFVPHWVATASDDATIRIWDIRFKSNPVAILKQHTHSVQCVLHTPFLL